MAFPKSELRINAEKALFTTLENFKHYGITCEVKDAFVNRYKLTDTVKLCVGRKNRDKLPVYAIQTAFANLYPDKTVEVVRSLGLPSIYSGIIFKVYK